MREEKKYGDSWKRQGGSQDEGKCDVVEGGALLTFIIISFHIVNIFRILEGYSKHALDVLLTHSQS